MKRTKSDMEAAKYMHRGCYINKFTFCKGWYVHFATVDAAKIIPKGLKADTLERLIFEIERCFNRKNKQGVK